MLPLKYHTGHNTGSAFFRLFIDNMTANSSALRGKLSHNCGKLTFKKPEENC